MRNSLCQWDNVTDKHAWRVTSRRQDKWAVSAATRLLVPRGPMALDRLQDKGGMTAATRQLVPWGPEARDCLQVKEQAATRLLVPRGPMARDCLQGKVQQQLHNKTWRRSLPSSSRPSEMESNEPAEK